VSSPNANREAVEQRIRATAEGSAKVSRIAKAKSAHKKMRLTICLVGAVLVSLLALTWVSRDEALAKSAVQVNQVQQSGSEESGWQKIDAGAFSILAPSGWKFRRLQGIDSYVGEFTGSGIVLKFDFGGYSDAFREEKKPAYVVVHKSIGGIAAKIVSPEKPGHGVTGVYFPKTFGSNKLSLFGHDLTAEQQELVMQIFETIRVGSTVPPVLPPPAKNK
jgi:hypothetical protein